MSYALYIDLQGDKKPPYLATALKKYAQVRVVRSLEQGLEILAAPKQHHPKNTHLNPFSNSITHEQQVESLRRLSELLDEKEVTFCGNNHKLDGRLPDVVILNGNQIDYEHTINEMKELKLEKLLKTPRDIGQKEETHHNDRFSNFLKEQHR